MVSAPRVLLIAPLIAALHGYTVVLIGEGRRPKLSYVVPRYLGALPVVILAEIIAYLGIGVASFFLIVPGILLALCWSVVA